MGIGFGQFGVGRHGQFAPFTDTPIANALHQLGLRFGLARVLGSDIFVRGTHQFGGNSMAAQAVILAGQCLIGKAELNARRSAFESFDIDIFLATQRLETTWLHDLNPVAVRVFDERDIFHLALVGTLHKNDLILIKPSCRCIQVGHRKADVPKALRLRVAIVVFEVGVEFGAPIVGQFQNSALGKSPGRAFAYIVRRLLAFCGAMQEVQGKLHLREVKFSQQTHPHHAGVKGQCDLRVFDAQHGVIEHKSLGLRGHGGTDTGLIFGGKTHKACLLKAEILARQRASQRHMMWRWDCDGKANYLPTAATGFGAESSVAVVRLGMGVTLATAVDCACSRSMWITQRRK